MTPAAGLALVTGGAKGIGRAVSDGLAKSGWDVVIAGRDESAIARAVDDIGRTYSDVTAVGQVLDVASPASVDQAFTKISSDHGHLSLLVNCAGVISRGPAEEVSEEDWLRVVNTDLSGAFRCSKAAFPDLSVSENASIINIGSVAGTVGLPGRVAYTTAKTGLEGLTRVLALEWASSGIRVNTVAPGYTRTEMVVGGIATGVLDEAALTSRIPLARLAEPREIANVVVFLASPEAGYMTGQCLVVDGGFTVNGNSDG